MKEKAPAFAQYAKERKVTGNLYDFARIAKNKYFADQLRYEKKGEERFDVFESVPEGVIEDVESFLNKTLDAGGKIAIIDLTQKDMTRVHALEAKHYSRFVLSASRRQHRVEEDLRKNFFVLLSGSIFYANPSMFLDIVSDKSTIDVSWQESEDPNLRFAVLTYQKGVWGVVLDFRINQWEGDPSWKVNTGIYS